MTGRVMIIPAAGLGSRLCVPVPKVLVEVNRRPMIEYIFDLYSDLVDSFVLVVSPQAETLIVEYTKSSPVSCTTVVQNSPTGMLDAILVPMQDLRSSRPAQIWISWCDQVAIQAETVRKLSAICTQEENWHLVLPTIRRRQPYIHLEQDAEGVIRTILHRREGDPMPDLGLSDMGLFALSEAAYFDLLPVYASDVPTGHATGERNFLPFITWLNNHGKTRIMEGSHYMESVGINTPQDLKKVEEWLNCAQ